MINGTLNKINSIPNENDNSDMICITFSTLRKLFFDLRKNYFRLFFHYLYFDIARYSYLQLGVVVPYLILGPTIVAGVITLGLIQQIVRAFERILGSFQFLVRNWPIIVELISVYKRLSAFERVLATKKSS